MATLDEVLAEATKNGRICPMPMKWNELYHLLPGRRRVGNGWEPALPLVLGAWYCPGVLKTIRLREHLEWAAAHGALDAVYAYLRSLPEDDWFHLDD